LEFKSPSDDLQSSLAERDNAVQKRPPPLRPKRSDELLAEAMLSPSSTLDISPNHSAGFVHPQNARSVFETISPPSPKLPVRWRSMRLPSTRALIGSAADYLAAPELYGEPRPAKELAGKRNSMDSLRDRPPLRLNKPLPPISFRAQLELVPEEPENIPSVRESFYSMKDRTMSDPELATLWPPRRRTHKYKEILGISFDREERPAANPSVALGIKGEVAEKPVAKPAERLAERLGERAAERVAERPAESPAGRRPARRPERPTQKLESFTDIEASWEDDIDFCYDQQAESHCNFNWNGTSVFNDASSDEELDVDDHQELIWGKKNNQAKDRESVASVSVSYSDADDTMEQVDDLYNLSESLPDDDVPELDRHSSRTGSTSSLSPPTSADGHDSGPENDNPIQIQQNSPPLIMTPHTAPQLPQINIKPVISAEDLYHDLLSDQGLDDDVDELPIPIPEKSPLRQMSLRQNRTLESVLPRRLSRTPEPSTLPAKNLTINSMVATLRGQLDTRASSPAGERRFSRPSSPPRDVRRSHRMSGTQTRRSSGVMPHSVPQSPLLSRVASVESLIAPMPLRLRKPLTPPDTAKMPAAGSDANPWASALSPASLSYDDFTRNPYVDSPPATPPAGLHLDARSNPLKRRALAAADPSARFFKLSSTWMESEEPTMLDDCDDRSVSEYSVSMSCIDAPAALRAARRTSTGSWRYSSFQTGSDRKAVMI